ncbi:MAG: hypothetical protein JNK48_25200 [Bryobacterales bacterium]|nr:hypothetical protein [Bryobacterales bacterium]
MQDLTIEALCAEAKAFSKLESGRPEPSLYGITDGKAVGTYLEHKFRAFLADRYAFAAGNSANGIDFPSLGVDMKVTSLRQPQSSCPFKSARQKIFGLGYSLIVFVYSKLDDPQTQTGALSIEHTIYIDKTRTADFQTTRGLRQILENDGNQDDIAAFLLDRMLPVDEAEAHIIAQEILDGTPVPQGYLTVSNALQWRLQYRRVIAEAGKIPGIGSIL